MHNDHSPIISEDESQNEEKRYNYLKFSNIGLFLQYFYIGIVYMLTINLTYEFFRSYLGINGEMCNLASVAISAPWTFKLFYGIVNDCIPILGYRRKSYMLLGWSGCLVVGIIIAMTPFPSSRYIYEKINSEIDECSSTNMNQTKLQGANSDFAYEKIALHYMALLLLYNVFVVMADVAMDGLMVQYARGERLHERGRAQTYIYTTRHVGFIFAALIKAFGLNWYMYAGPWCDGLQMSTVLLMLIIVPVLAIPTVAFMTTELKCSKQEDHISHIIVVTWNLMTSIAVQQIIFFGMVAAFLQSLASPADIMIISKWVNPSSMVYNMLGTIFGDIMFIIGTIIFATYLLNYNWRITYGVTQVVISSLGLAATLIVTFDIIRNQYFYLSDSVAASIFAGVNYVCTLLLIVELAEPKVEGILYSLISTTNNIGLSFGNVAVNLIVLPFGVSSETRFVRDNNKDRIIVASQAIFITSLQLLVLFFLPLLPPNKAQTREMKLTKGFSSSRGTILLFTTIMMFISCVLLSFTWPYISPFLHSIS